MKIDEPLWTSSEIFGATGCGSPRPWFADGLHTDSRDVLPGDLFVALAGQQMDGHDFVMDALDRGAPAAIVSRTPDGLSEKDPRLVLVQDVQETLEKMASYAQLRAPVSTIAVTGSAGKTSIVQALNTALARSGETHASVKSFNNYVGLPLSMARMPRGTRYGVFEVGISLPGEMTRRASIVSPDVAIISTIGAAHVGNFESVEDIAREKAKVFDGMKPGATAIIGIDSIYADLLIDYALEKDLKVVTVSAEKEADVHPVQQTAKYDCTCLTADVGGTMITYKISQPGTEWVLNSLLILAAIKVVGADLGMTALALASLQAEPGRGRIHTLEDGGQEFLLIDDSYNANPVSMHAAFGRMGMIPVAHGARKLAVLADMQELGQATEQAHDALAGKMRSCGLHKVYALGDGMTRAARTAGLVVEQFNDLGELTEKVVSEIRNGDALLVKGANMAKLGCVVDTILDSATVSTDFGHTAGIYTQVAE